MPVFWRYIMQYIMEMDFNLEEKFLQTIVNSFFSEMSFDSISILLNYNKNVICYWI